MLPSGCKVNLGLQVGLRHKNGYHDIETCFLALPSPADTLTIQYEKHSAHQAGSVRVNCATHGIDPYNNTLTKAFSLYSAVSPLPFSITVDLEKKVPHGAGLGGGSANAAVFLTFLDTLATEAEVAPMGLALYDIAAKVGADVPFFLSGKKIARATGIGDKLEPCANPVEGSFMVLVCPPVAVSTPWAYAALDALRENLQEEQNLHLTSSRQEAKTCFANGFSLHNDFEEVVFPAYPELAQLRDVLLHFGAETALLSGTGSSVFGIFSKKEYAKKAALHIRFPLFMHAI